MKLFDYEPYRRLYNYYMENPPPRNPDGTCGSSWYEAFWKGYDGVKLIYPRFTPAHVAWKAGKDYRKILKKRS